MQLTSKDGNMVVDFYPVKFATGEIHNRLMLKVVTFCGATQSKRYINKKDFQYEFDSRTHGYGYHCLLYTSPSPRDRTRSRMPSSA